MVREASETEGRLNIYRRIKADFPTTERYVANIRSVGVRRMLAGLRVGCLPLAVETGRYTGVPLCQRSCRLCDRGEVEDHADSFFNYLPRFQPIQIAAFQSM